MIKLLMLCIYQQNIYYSILMSMFRLFSIIAINIDIMKKVDTDMCWYITIDIATSIHNKKGK